MAVKMPDLVAYGNRVNQSTSTGSKTDSGVKMPNLVSYGNRVAAEQTAKEAAKEETDGKSDGLLSAILSVANRAKNTASGAVKSLGASYTNVGGMAAEGAGKWNIRISNYTNKDTLQSAQEAVERYQAMLDSGKWADGRTMTAADRKQVQSMLAANQRKLTAQESYTNAVEASDKAVADQAYQTADRLSESSAQDLATAKEGLGKVGQFAVDLGSQGVQMAGDIAASALIPGSGLALMGARSAGSAAQEARQSGATYGQQLAYGLGSGAVSIATEKLSSVAAPFKKAFGGGVLDDALSKAVSKMSGSAVGKAVLSMLSEGGEEAVEDLVQPILQRMTYDKDALSRYGDSDYWSQMLYDGLVGAAMGGIGSGVEAVQNRITSKKATGNAAGTQTAVQEGNITTQAQNAAEGVQTVSQAGIMEQEAARLFGQDNAAPETGTAGSVKAGQVTTIKNPYRGEVPTQTARQSTAPVQVSNDSLTTAQNRIAGARGLESAMPGQSFKSSLKNAYKGVFKAVKGVPVEGMTFNGQPYTVDINSNVPGKVISDVNLTAEKLALLDNLTDVVRNGIYVGSGEYVQHSSKNKPTLRYDYFETPVSINGEQYIAKFDVEVLPGANNYRTHQIVKMDLIPTEASLAGPTPAASPVVSSPSEGTRPLNVDYNIAQGAENVKSQGQGDSFAVDSAEGRQQFPYINRYLDGEGQAKNANADPLLELLMGGKRVDMNTLTEAQQNAVYQANEAGTVGMDAEGRVFQIDPEQHIDRRDSADIASRKVNAFQFDHPQLHSYYKSAAEVLMQELAGAQPGGQTQSATGEYGQTYSWRTRRRATPRIETLLDGGTSYARIEKALDAIIHDKGQENYADAKRVEMVLDDMLTNGYNDGGTQFVPANEAYLSMKDEIAGSNSAERGHGLDGIEAANAGSAEAAARYDNLGSAKRGFTTAGMEGTEKTSRLADSMPYNQWQEAATGLTREDYSKIFRYESQSEAKSLHLAEELLYLMKDGRKTFLRDVDEAAFHELVQSLDDATAWNGPQTDAARMIQTELQGKAVNAEIDETEYTDFLKIMQAHTTATGQGVQANAKWSRNDNSNGQSTELEALKRLKNSKLSEEEQSAIFRQIVQWDMNIEAVSPGDTASMKKIIMEVAQKRGVLGGWLGKVRTSWVDNALDSLTFDQLKQFAYSSTAAYASDTTPANAGQKMKTVQVLNMLSSPVTAASNLTGNASFYGIDAVAMDVSTLLDMALSNVTGTRSIAKEHFPLGKSSLSAGAMAAKMSLAEIALDVDMGSERGRYGTGSNRTYKANGRGVFNTGQATDLFAERVLSSFERNQAYLLTAPDEFFKGMARSTAENTQKLVDSGKIKTENKAYAAEQAEQLAKYRTFQDQSIPAAWTQGFHDMLNLIGVGDSGKKMYGLKVHSFGAGDFAEAFTRVAGNLVSRGVEYSPVNAAKGLVETVKLVADAAGGKAVDPAAQSNAVASIGRGATGSVLAFGAVALAKAGLLRQADDESDEDVAALNQSEGITGTQLNLSAAERLLRGESAEWQYGDTLVDLSRIQPLNFILNLGTEIAKEDQNPLLSVFYGTMNAAANAGGELPMLQTVGNTAKDIIKYNKDPWAVIGEQFGKTLISSVTPNIISGIAKGTDDRPRNTYSGDGLTDILLDTAKSRIPGLRQTLPGSVNTMGEEKLYQGRDDGLLNVLLNPIGVNTYTQSDVSKEMQRVREETGETGFYPSKKIPSTLSGNGKTVELDYEERQDYQRDRGATTMIVTADLIGQSYYKSATAEKQAELLNDAYDYARMAATSNVLGTDAVAKWVGNTIAAQKSTGLTPATVIQYRDMLSEAKETKGSAAANSAVREKIKADSRLTTAQKNALDDIVLSDGIYIPKDLNVDYTSDETYTISQMSEGAQKRWDSIKSQFGMSAADYEQAWGIYQSNDLTASEKRAQISALGYNGAAVYKALGKKLS